MAAPRGSGASVLLRIGSALQIGMLLFNAVVVAPSTSIVFETVESDKCHLIWRRSDLPTEKFMGSNYASVVYFAGIIVPLLVMKPARDAVTLTAVGLLIFLTSLIFFYRDGSFSSMWCFSAILYAVTILYLTKKNK
jgi:hypothetical protein